MVTELEHDGTAAVAWQLQPTRSMTWLEAQRVIAAVTLVSLAIGGFFLAVGLPLVLPFSGLEALAVGAAFYVVLREGERREIIRLDGDRLIIERGARERISRDEFNCYWVRIELRGRPGRWQPQSLTVRQQGREIELGRFLTDGERESFSLTLINAVNKKR